MLQTTLGIRAKAAKVMNLNNIGRARVDAERSWERELILCCFHVQADDRCQVSLCEEWLCFVRHFWSFCSMQSLVLDIMRSRKLNTHKEFIIEVEEVTRYTDAI